jgi:anthranilate synthase component 1
MAGEGDLIPVYRELLADTETPVTMLLKLADRPHVFLLESVEGGEKWGRYSFLGTDPRIVVRIRKKGIVVEENGLIRQFPHQGDPLGFLKELLGNRRPAPVEGLPRFYGGAVGFFGYDVVHYFERIPESPRGEKQTDEAVFLITDVIAIFDNVRHTIKIVSTAIIEAGCDLQAIYAQTTRKIDAMAELLHTPVPSAPAGKNRPAATPLQAEMPKERYIEMVNRAREYIMAGEAIQVVLSQRFRSKTEAAPADLYRALRFINPSPYLFFLKLNDLHLIGSSPEVMVRLEDGIAELKPIAGTRRRGKTEQEDRLLADELLQDPKERAEHVMLVDLGRNDLGRVARTGSVQVVRLMAVERYSHVMHLVSLLQAQMQAGKNAFDLLKASFPAGTLSGAPKVRAMEIIAELEPSPRGPYGGAVGYFSYGGNADFCITIRTILMKDGELFVQSGAGIVADSDPEKEYMETLGKAEGLFQAIRLAEEGLELRH